MSRLSENSLMFTVNMLYHQNRIRTVDYNTFQAFAMAYARENNLEIDKNNQFQEKEDVMQKSLNAFDKALKNTSPEKLSEIIENVKGKFEGPTVGEYMKHLDEKLNDNKNQS